jgi:hypothetical protein
MMCDGWQQQKVAKDASNPEVQQELKAVTRAQIEASYNFFRACDSASIDYANRIIQECVQNVANVVHVGLGGTKEQLEAVTEQVATSCVKVRLSSWVQERLCV